MNKIRIIVIGHGKFASGIRSSLELFIGNQNSADFIDFTKEMSDVELEQKLAEQINDEEDLIFFTDIVGGTPYKEAAKLAFNKKNVGVVAGCNLSSLLETAFKEYHNKEELMQELVSTTKKSAQIFQKNDIQDVTEEENDFSDGI